MRALDHEPTTTLSDLFTDAARPLSMVLGGANAVFAVKNLDGTYVFAAPTIERLTGRPARFVVGRTDFDLFPAHVARAIRGADHSVLESGRALSGEDAVRVDGEERSYLTTRFPVRAEDGRAIGIGLVALDITQRKRAEDEIALARERAEQANAELKKAIERLEETSSTDRLTGAWNRGRLEDAAQNEISRKLRYGHPVSLIVLDVDHFKRVNDMFGHQAGDRVLVEICNVIREAYRGTDVLARWGGEEFVVLAANTTLDGAVLLAERLRARIEEHTFETARRVTVSLGVAEHHGAEGWNEWFERADAALFRAKRGGRNHVEVDVVNPGEPAAERVGGTFVQLVWHGAYECGNALLDAEHRHLFDAANEVLGKLLAEHPREEIESAGGRLVDEVSRHFADEEKILRERGYPDAAAHAQLHAALRERAGQLMRDVVAHEAGIGDVVQFLAYDLVARHLLGADRRFFPYL